MSTICVLLDTDAGGGRNPAKPESGLECAGDFLVLRASRHDDGRGDGPFQVVRAQVVLREAFESLGQRRGVACHLVLAVEFGAALEPGPGLVRKAAAGLAGRTDPDVRFRALARRPPRLSLDRFLGHVPRLVDDVEKLANALSQVTPALTLVRRDPLGGHAGELQDLVVAAPLPDLLLLQFESEPDFRPRAGRGAVVPGRWRILARSGLLCRAHGLAA